MLHLKGFAIRILVAKSKQVALKQETRKLGLGFPISLQETKAADNFDKYVLIRVAHVNPAHITR